jgi:pyruvate dehydrogenase E2 component (dihydrolipoamide acetyltransferase)
MSENYTLVKLTPLRKVIAARMADAKRTIPEFRLVLDVEVDALMVLRSSLQARAPGEKVSMNDLLIKACATALTRVPAINIQWTEEGIRQFHSADISVVMAIEGGVSAPIVKGADRKSLRDISREVSSLAERAKRNALRMDEISGGSFTLSNLGMYGIDQFDAIINPPQCAVLAVGAVKPKVLPSTDLTPRVARAITLTLTVDHRAIDGATGAAFLNALKNRIEEPSSLAD